MAHRISLEIFELIFENLVYGLVEEKKIREAHGLLLVSKSVQRVAGRFLYKKTDMPFRPFKRVLHFYHAMMERPTIAPCVQEISLKETTGQYDDQYCPTPRPREAVGNPWGGTSAEKLAAVKEVLKSKFKANRVTIPFEEEEWIGGLCDTDVVKWAFLLQLPNLVSLKLETQTAELAQLAIFLRLPRLKDLTFTIDVESEGQYYGDVPFEDILESIISSTDRLRSLTYEDVTGSLTHPKTHDAPKLKRILDKHAARTVEYLSIVLAMNDEKDWRLPQEYTDIEGCFGSMKNFVKLEELYIQFEVLLGRPEANENRLKDVLPPRLKRLRCLSICDFHGQDDNVVWSESSYLPHFEELAEAAEDGENLVSLDSVKVDIYRKDDFNSRISGDYVDGILGPSPISFGYW
jgi:hypothetical protein